MIFTKFSNQDVFYHQKVFRTECIFFKYHAREQERARKFGTYDMNSSLYFLGCIFSFPSRRCDVPYLPTSTSTTRATNMSGAFCGVHHHFGESSVPDVRISFKAVHGFICPTKYRCSFVADIRTRVSAHSQIA